MSTSVRQYLLRNLKDRTYRDRYVATNIRNAIALQIRQMREDREMTQSQLGELAGMAQERISKLEDLDYGSPSLKTLERLAVAFDVGLLVRFVPYSQLIDWVINSSARGFTVPSFEKDTGLADQPSEQMRSAITAPDIVLRHDRYNEYGDNDWPDNLYLPDVIEKHLGNHLE